MYAEVIYLNSQNSEKKIFDPACFKKGSTNFTPFFVEYHSLKHLIDNISDSLPVGSVLVTARKLKFL